MTIKEWIETNAEFTVDEYSQSIRDGFEVALEKLFQADVETSASGVMAISTGEVNDEVTDLIVIATGEDAKALNRILIRNIDGQDKQ